MVEDELKTVSKTLPTPRSAILYFFIKYFSKFYSTGMNKINNKFQKKVSVELLLTVKI
jgi:hypothetical protein